jgi:hypothetical protein
MIGEGTHSTNQRRHNYVQEQVEVGFFTDPTVCIGCKACEVACKEWNEVPDDGFTWSGNSYDNTGHLGASTWRHVLFLEQDQQKGSQIVGCHSLGSACRSRQGRKNVPSVLLDFSRDSLLRPSIKMLGYYLASKITRSICA